jgi:hypothetical protein
VDRRFEQIASDAGSAEKRRDRDGYPAVGQDNGVAQLLREHQPLLRVTKAASSVASGGGVERELAEDLHPLARIEVGLGERLCVQSLCRTTSFGDRAHVGEPAEYLGAQRPGRGGVGGLLE